MSARAATPRVSEPCPDCHRMFCRGCHEDPDDVRESRAELREENRHSAWSFDDDEPRRSM